MNDKEIVICSAVYMPEVKNKDGSLRIIRGHRHHNCFETFRYFLESGQITEEQWSNHPDHQGFITSRNRYVTREEGRLLQDLAGIESVDPDGYRPGTLFSEDLY